MARRSAAVFDGFEPLFMVADGVRDEFFGRLESFKILLRPESAPVVVRNEHSLFSHEQHPALPLRILLVGEKRRMFSTVIPGQLHGRLAGAKRGILSRRELIAHDQPRWR